MSTQNKLLFAYYFLSIYLLKSSTQQQPLATNCPQFFKYAYDPKYGGHYGHVTLQKDASSISEIQVNMSVNTPTHVYNNLRIITLSKTQEFFYRDAVLQYAVQFPLQTAIPKLISLKFNGKILCSGISDPLVPGIIQTHMWAKSTVTTYGPFQSSQGQKPFGIFSVTSTPVQAPTLTSIDEKHVASAFYSTVPASGVPFDCGIAAEDGQEQGASISKYPWLAAVMYKQNSDYIFQCTGNLISDKHVLTAGHCVNNSAKPTTSANKDLVIILGKPNVESGAEGGVVRKVRAVVTHPNYQEKSANSDLAIIVLKDPVILQPAIVPVCLWNGGDDLSGIVGKSGTVIGWGKNQAARLPRKIDLPVVPREQCLGSSKIYKGYATPGTFCAGTKIDLNEACAESSGAGFVMKDDITRKWYLRGLIGHSLREPLSLSCDLTHYFLFTDIANTRLWIDEEMKKY